MPWWQQAGESALPELRPRERFLVSTASAPRFWIGWRCECIQSEEVSMAKGEPANLPCSAALARHLLLGFGRPGRAFLFLFLLGGLTRSAPFPRAVWPQPSPPEWVFGTVRSGPAAEDPVAMAAVAAGRTPH